MNNETVVKDKQLVMSRAAAKQQLLRFYKTQDWCRYCRFNFTNVSDLHSNLALFNIYIVALSVPPCKVIMKVSKVIINFT